MKAKAIASLRHMVASFNGMDDEGRQGAVVRDLQHAFAMLLKAALREKNVRVFDIGRTVAFVHRASLFVGARNVTERAGGRPLHAY